MHNKFILNVLRFKKLSILFIFCQSTALIFAGHHFDPYPVEQIPKGICEIWALPKKQDTPSHIAGDVIYASGTLLGNKIVLTGHTIRDASQITYIYCSGNILINLRTDVLKIYRHPCHGKEEGHDYAVIVLDQEYPTDIELPRSETIDDHMNGEYYNSLYWFGYGPKKGESFSSGITGGSLGTEYKDQQIDPSKYIITKDDNSYAVQGDSGGPLLYMQGDYFLYLGLISHVDENLSISVFERVKHYIDWINDPTSNTKCGVAQPLK